MCDRMALISELNTWTFYFNNAIWLCMACDEQDKQAND